MAAQARENVRRMHTVSLEEAQHSLSELVGKLPAEGEVRITQQGRTVARLVPAWEDARTEEQKIDDAKRRVSMIGLWKGQIDEAPGCWDDPEPDFEPYMQ